MDSTEHKEDYRHFMIAKWVTSRIETFKKPSNSDFEKRYRYYKTIIEKYFPIKKDIEILEIGCGWGQALYAFKKFGFRNIDAIDMIPECCAYVKQNFEINTTCIDVLQFFKKNQKKYDVITAFDVLEHFNKNEIVSMMLSIYDSLNNNGVFIMRSPNGGSPCGLFIRYSGFTHEVAFTRLSIRELFKAIGFQKVSCIPEPDFNRNYIRGLIKKMAMRFISILLSLDPDYIRSMNIIGIGYK